MAPTYTRSSHGRGPLKTNNRKHLRSKMRTSFRQEGPKHSSQTNDSITYNPNNIVTTAPVVEQAQSLLMVSREIEVRWKLSGGRPVWWKAKVLKGQTQTHSRMENATTSLQYEAAYGFPSTRYQVRFRNGQLLEHISPEGENCVCTWRARQPKRRQSTSEMPFNDRSRRLRMPGIRKDMNTLRRGVVRNREELDMLRKKLEFKEASNSAEYMEYADRREREVLTFLTYRLAMELRKSPRIPLRTQRNLGNLPSSLETSSRGISARNVVISADCEQRIFEKIAKRVREAAAMLCAEPLFRPDYELTQLPSQECPHFSIVFGTFSDLCHCIGIDSTSDRLSMLCRYGMSRGEGTMRILGALNRNPQEDDEPLELFIGSSCGHNYEEGNSNDTQPLQAVWVISRGVSAWINEDWRYDMPLRTEARSHSRVVRQACLNDKAEMRNAFELRWKKAPGVGSRMWSRALTHSEIVVGKLEVVLPCIVVTGSVLCDEYTTCLTEELFKAIVQ